MTALVLLVLITAFSVGNRAHLDNHICDLPTKLVDEIKSYQPTVQKIIDAVTKGKFKGETYGELAKFVDTFGSRMAGSKNLENSIDYMLNLLKNMGLDNVHGENVSIPHWERGEESAELMEPRHAKIAVIGIGGTVATPPSGITAEAIVVQSFEELDKVASKAKGKIIVFNEEFTSYSDSVQYRVHGSKRAGSVGAVAALIRSVTPFSLYTPHAGMGGDWNDAKAVPAACITVEDARMLQRMQNRGEKIVIKLNMENKFHPNATSRNVVAEVEGKQKPEKVVMVSGHIDSWDVGVGAMDDGGGAFISWYAVNLLRKLGLEPKRTVRAVLWTAEEMGLFGVKGYNEAHKNELDNFTFVMESDIGTFTPLGLEYSTSQKGGCIIKEVMKLLSPINATQAVYNKYVGSDITIWAGKVPTGSLLNENDKYFWYHHTNADTMDVLDADTLDKCTALFASVAYVIADLSEEFPRDFDRDSKN